MNQLFKLFLVLSFLLVPNLDFYAQDDILQANSKPVLVNDDAGLFSAEERADLEQMLVAYDDSTSTQIAVVTVKSLNGYAPSDYAARLGEQWGVGRSEKNNGIVILIKPRIGNERGEVYIATGYGVEHILTDSRVGRIIDNYMIPYLPDNYYMATKSAATVIIQLLSGEFKSDPKDDIGSIIPVIIILIVIILFFYMIGKSQKGDDDDWTSNNSGGKGPKNRGRGPIFFPPIGGRGFGGRGGGGFGGGGFGGFGGGSFGGGGAGRSF